MSVEHRDARHYVGMPLNVTIERLPHVVGEEFDRVADLLAARGVALHGAVIRYVAARPDGTFDIEVGHLVDAAQAAEARIEADVLLAGRYSVARHDGPYRELGRVTRELMDSWAHDDVEPAVAHTTVGEEYAAWYELYLDMPREGPTGPEGPVEVGILTR